MSRGSDRTSPASDSICPICASELHSGQGLYACPCCEWVGVVEDPTREPPAFRDRVPAELDRSDRWDLDVDYSDFDFDRSPVDFDRSPVDFDRSDHAIERSDLPRDVDGEAE